MNYTLVDGFSQALKCTPEGRALMNLDYQQLLHKIEAISKCRINQKQRHFTETYIRAYYFTEDELTSWIPQNSSYSKRQLRKKVLIEIQGFTYCLSFTICWNSNFQKSFEVPWLTIRGLLYQRKHGKNCCSP